MQCVCACLPQEEWWVRLTEQAQIVSDASRCAGINECDGAVAFHGFADVALVRVRSACHTEDVYVGSINKTIDEQRAYVDTLGMLQTLPRSARSPLRSNFQRTLEAEN